MKTSLRALSKNLLINIKNLPDIEISGISLNSSKIRPGDLFIAISGSKADGHDFISEAIDNGAKAVVTNGRNIDGLNIPQLKVNNPRKAASIIASNFYQK